MSSVGAASQQSVNTLKGEYLVSGTTSAQSVNDEARAETVRHQVSGNNSTHGPSSSMQTVYKTTDSGETVLASGDETGNAIESIAMIHFAHICPTK